MPSIRAAAADARRVALRFPVVLGCGFVAAIIGSIIVSSWDAASEVLVAVGISATLGLALFTAAAVFAERVRSERLGWVLALLGTLGLIAFGFAWYHWSDPIRFRRYAQMSIGLHLLVAFIPYLKPGESNGFWQYNRSLFLRFLTAALYSSVLYIGLAVALAAINKLFQVKIPGSAYGRLWVWIAFVFNTWFFLGGVPEDLPALDHRRDYPRGLKVFTQFILLPLVVVYLAILTAYLVRVVFTGQWPSGWIGWLVSSVAAVGILSLLLVHPIREAQENRWVATFTRWFYVAMLPAIGMLLVAIGKRVSQYGITEDRYFITILALWLAATAVLFIVRRGTDIRWIPISLCILAFITMAGPFGAYSVSLRSQTHRLRHLLQANGVMVNGVVKPVSTTVPGPAQQEMSSVMVYLLDVHGVKSVRAVLGDAMPPVDRPDFPSAHRSRNRVVPTTAATDIMTALGMRYVSPWESPQSVNFGYVPYLVTLHAVPIGGAAYHIHLDGRLPNTFVMDDERWTFQGSRRGAELTTGNGKSLKFALDTLVTFAQQNVSARDTVPPPILTAEGAGLRGMLVPSSYSGLIQADTLYFYTLAGELFLTPVHP
jgi:Domain of unknown function (DUF4153)